MKIWIFEKMTVQDTFWAQLDPIWAPKREQKEPETSPKRTQNESKIDFKIDSKK